MLKKLLIAGFASALCFNASADLYFGLGTAKISDEIKEINADIDVNALFVSAGYDYQYNDKISIIPEFRLGTGVTRDDLGEMTANHLKLSVSRFVSAGVKIDYQVANDISLFLVPSYANMKASVKGVSSSMNVSESDSEFGIGAGVTYQLSDKATLEFGYEYFDGTDILGLQVRTKI